jgi:flagellar motor switch protein FliM
MNVTLYDFRKPVPLASDLEHPVAGWLRTGCALATRHWGKLLPFPAELRLAHLDTSRAEQALGGLSDAMLGYPVTFKDSLPTLMIWPRPLALALVAALLCDGAGELPADRELTAVEENLFAYFLQDLFLPSFKETWPTAEPVKVELGVRENHPRWSRLFQPQDSLAVATFAVQGPFGQETGMWMFLKKALSPQFLPGKLEPKPEGPAVQQRLETLVRELPVPVTITLGSVQLPLTQLSQLRPGDVIVLDQRVSQPLSGLVAGDKKMRGWPGRVGSRQAFQVDSIDTPS